MTTSSDMLQCFQDVVTEYGQKVRVRNFTTTLNTGSYDDFRLLTSGTDVWTTALVQPVGTGRGEYQLLQQGLLKTDDLKVYFDSSVSLSGTFRIGIGSANPPTGEYSIAEANLIESPFVNGSSVYKKAFVTIIPGGSLSGE